MTIREFKIERIDEDRLVAYLVVRGTKIYNVRITLTNDIAKVSGSDCDCPFGSYYSQTKNNNKKVCKHLTKCLKLLKHMNYINGWEVI